MKTPIVPISSSSASSNSYPIFVYGTLMAPQVIEAVLGRSLTQTEEQSTTTTIKPAYLHTRQKFTRHPVRNHVFPAVIDNTFLSSSSSSSSSSTLLDTSSSSVRVDGLLMSPFTSKEMKLLDWFESDEYTRQIVDVVVVADDDGSNEGRAAAAAAVSDPSSTSTSSSTSSSSSIVQAQAYIWRNDLISQLDLSKSWSYENFVEQHLEWYLEHTVRPCRDEMIRLGIT
jgi:Gamma-glutamyl cyclotransferase, AIG2-like